MAGNANSGGRPLPRAIKEARGTLRPDRDGDEAEVVDLPAPEAGITPPPDWLDPEALREWNRVVPMLEAARVLSVVDYSQLAAYATAHGQAVKATKQLKRESLTIKRANGSRAANPLIAIAREARAQALRIAIEYGLTPAARTRIRPTDEAPNVPEAPSSGDTNSTAAASFLFAKAPVPVPAPLQLVSTAPKTAGEKP